MRWNAGLVFGLVGVGGSLLGTRLNTGVDPDVLLLAFAGLMGAAAAAMLARQHRGSEVACKSSVEMDRSPPGAPSVRMDSTLRTAVRIVLAGSVVEFMTGFFGVGGGFVVVPALVLVLGFSMPEAVGTSLVVIAVNSGSALAERAGSSTFPWAVIVPFTLAAKLGSLAGNRVATRVPADRLTRAFATLLVAVACYVAAESISGLLG